MLILQCMSKFMREQHLTDPVAMRDQAGGTAPQADIDRTLDQHHLLLMRFVKARDLAVQQLHCLALEIHPGRINSSHRAGEAADAHFIFGVIAGDFLSHHLERLVAGLEHERNRGGEIEAAKALDARFDFLRLGLVDGSIVGQRVGASAEREHQQRDELQAPGSRPRASRADQLGG